jgi:glycosyltransferase involved in cell wall biosynthesis
MKVLHLATHDILSGAARAAYRQHTALREYGVDSAMLVRHKHSNDISVVQYAGSPNAGHRAARGLRRAWIGYKEKQSRKHCRQIICGLNDPRADLLRSVDRRIADADVINIHKVEHFVDLPAFLLRLGSSKPVVMTMHDLSAIAGGCDYPGSCARFEASCGRCPIIDSESPSDYSSRIFAMKHKAYRAIPPTQLIFVANSRWTAGHASRSGLVNGAAVKLIHYGIDQSVYNPERRQEARQALGLETDERVLLFAAHDVGLKHKGGYLLAEALAAVAQWTQFRVLTMGSGQLESNAVYRHTHFGRVESDELQALLYKAADLFLMPSLEEAFGQTALEAAACGTVVAGFEVGGIVDIIEDGLNGILVNRGDVRALGEAISQLLDNHSLRDKWRSSCRAWVEERFSYNRNAAAYFELYRSLLSPAAASEHTGTAPDRAR